MFKLLTAASIGVALAVGLGAICLLPASAQDKPKDKPTAAKRKLARTIHEVMVALEEPTEFDFVETPLKDVVDALKARHHIEIQLDNRALASVGITPETPVTRRMKDISLRVALRILLSDLDMGFAVDNGVLIISPKNNARFVYQRMMDALDEPTEVDFIETPLKDVVEALKVRHGITIQLDAKAITDAGGAPDMPITRSLQGSLRSVLRLMLHDHELDFKVADEVILITTSENSAIREYDVSDLVPEGSTVDDLAKLVRFAFPRPPTPTKTSAANSPGSSVPAGSPAGSSTTAGDGGGTAERALATEIEIITYGPLFYVRSSDRGHLFVNDFLEDLRHRLKRVPKVKPDRSPAIPGRK